jgi:GNAT superfamily N-acetyltransferase
MNRDAMREVGTTLSRCAEAVFGDGGSSNAWGETYKHIRFKWLASIVLISSLSIELDFLAVDPEHQRRGIGKSLLSWGTERAKQESKDCYTVATAAGRLLYVAGGFAEVGQLEIFGVPHTQMIIKNDARWKTG